MNEPFDPNLPGTSVPQSSPLGQLWLEVDNLTCALEKRHPQGFSFGARVLRVKLDAVLKALQDGRPIDKVQEVKCG